MNRDRNEYPLSDEHQAELEDRAAELVDRDWLLGQPHRDDADARAAWQADVRAEKTRQADEYLAGEDEVRDMRWWIR